MSETSWTVGQDGPDEYELGPKGGTREAGCFGNVQAAFSRVTAGFDGAESGLSDGEREALIADLEAAEAAINGRFYSRARSILRDCAKRLRGEAG